MRVHFGVERGNKTSHQGRRVAFALHEIDELETGVIVHEHEHIPVLAVSRKIEGTHDVGVDETTRMARPVDAGRSVRQVCAVRLGTVGTGQILGARDSRGSVRRELRESLEVIEADVETSVQHLGDLVGSEGVEVRGGVRAVDAVGVLPFQGAWGTPLWLDRSLSEARASDGSNIPVIEIVAPCEGQGHELDAVSIHLHEAVLISEHDVDPGRGPELLDGDESLSEGGNASYVTEEYGVLLSVAVESHEGEVTDAGAVVLHPVSDGDGVDARAPVG